MLLGWSASRKLHVDQPVNIAVARHVWERENLVEKFVAARIKGLFLQFRLFSFKNNNEAPRETGELLAENDSENTQNATGLFYFCTSALILVINLLCFCNCGLFCLCYITKHLMTAPSGKKDVFSRECILSVYYFCSSLTKSLFF